MFLLKRKLLKIIIMGCRSVKGEVTPSNNRYIQQTIILTIKTTAKNWQIVEIGLKTLKFKSKNYDNFRCGFYKKLTNEWNSVKIWKKKHVVCGWLRVQVKFTRSFFCDVLCTYYIFFYVLYN